MAVTQTETETDRTQSVSAWGLASLGPRTEAGGRSHSALCTLHTANSDVHRLRILRVRARRCVARACTDFTFRLSVQRTAYRRKESCEPVLRTPRVPSPESPQTPTWNLKFTRDWTHRRPGPVHTSVGRVSVSASFRWSFRGTCPCPCPSAPCVLVLKLYTARKKQTCRPRGSSDSLVSRVRTNIYDNHTRTAHPPCACVACACAGAGSCQPR